MLIVFEGLDGSGKSTQVERAANWLRSQGRDVVTCREPGSTRLGEEIRGLLLHRHELAIDPHSEMLLFMAARSQLVRELIQPALHRGAWVLCDRFQMSTLVYQGHAGKVPLAAIRQVGEVAAAGLRPDYVFLLDLPPEAAASRLGRELDRMEARGPAYWQAVHAGFRQEAAHYGPGLSILDANRDPDTIAAEIARTLAANFPRELAGSA